MREELGKIDTSAIEELVRIKDEELVLQDRLQKMESNKKKVSDVVYKRVKKDYESRLRALSSEARPLKDSARTEYAKLRKLHESMESSLKEATLEKEELEFRRDLGEYEEDEFKSQMKELEAKLADRQKDLDDAGELKEQFLGAFHSPEELESAPEPPPAGREEERTILASDLPGAEAPAPREDERTILASDLPGAEAPAPRPEEHTILATDLDNEPAGADATIATTGPEKPFVPPPKLPPSPTPTGDQPASTVVFSMPRFVTLIDNEPAEEFVLKPGTTTIGRSPSNQIRLDDESVSRRHAQVIYSNDGFKLVDLGSKTGTNVNGKKVTEHMLADGDLVQLGTQRFVFRA